MWSHDSEMPSFNNAGLEGVPMRMEREALEEDRLVFRPWKALARWL